MQCNQICDWNDPSDGCVKPPAGFCPMSNVSAYQKPQTNADRIRAMSDEELAEKLGRYLHCGGCPIRENCKVDELPCENVVLEWLKQPAEGE